MLFYERLIITFKHSKCDNIDVSAFSNTDYTVLHFLFM